VSLSNGPETESYRKYSKFVIPSDFIARHIEQRVKNLTIIRYYLAPILNSVGITSSVDKASINLGLQIWNAILAFFGALAAETYGRRPLWLLSASGMLVSFIVITALSATFAEHHIQAAGTAVVAFLFIFFGFYDIA